MALNLFALAKNPPINLTGDTRPDMIALIRLAYTHRNKPPRTVGFWAVFDALPKGTFYFAMVSCVLWILCIYRIITDASMALPQKGGIAVALTAALLLLPLWNCFRLPLAKYKALRHGEKVTVHIVGIVFNQACLLEVEASRKKLHKNLPFIFLLEGASREGQPFQFWLNLNLDASVLGTGDNVLELDVLATADASSAVLLEPRFRRI
ncbi:MAG: hypothetical protein LBS89_04815 [Zoogloeaceae bacterium]|jgi:hypothetical protein|nr:hypothetical protein [Zoogloeaceae bacterium]